jgi:hypothetical protein
LPFTPLPCAPTPLSWILYILLIPWTTCVILRGNWYLEYLYSLYTIVLSWTDTLYTILSCCLIYYIILLPYILYTDILKGCQAKLSCCGIYTILSCYILYYILLSWLPLYTILISWMQMISWLPAVILNGESLSWMLIVYTDNLSMIAVYILYYTDI